MFSGDANFTTSTSPAITETTSKATSTTALVSSHNPSRSGQEVTFTATITSTAGTPTGTVSFFRVLPDTTREALGTMTLASGLATLTTGSLPVQTDMDIVAEYSGSLNHNTSALTIDQTVQRSLSKTLITSSKKNSKVGQPVTYNVTVGADGEGEGVPTGLVAIYRVRPNGTLQWIGRGNLRNGVTNIVVSDLPVGSYKIEAQYRGTETFRPSVRTMTQTVTELRPATTRTTRSTGPSSRARGGGAGVALATAVDIDVEPDRDRRGCRTARRISGTSQQRDRQRARTVLVAR